jgi:hypothetical protein
MDRLGKLDVASRDAPVGAARMPGRQLQMVRAQFPQITDA